MERHSTLSIIEIKFLQGFWLTRKEIMALTDYCADVTHLVRGLRERGVPVQCLPGKIANKTKWGVKADDLANHLKNPYVFRAKNIASEDLKHKENAIKSIRRIENTYGANLILDVIQPEKK
ncbi:TPA: hypothetical protein NKR26_002685 [Vibrio parahaemolyticus]|uniref:hypothetical protein n=1 Tax=Vibrio parahaemolyticus TaxID=670 RepID=UPI00235FFA10|nr:hypothetical protein [Vibrio parahaemolyticus]HCH1966391.1 hypothetical protein [Vibrio parahaemolyticus]